MSALFKIAEVSKLKKEEYMSYAKSLMAKWDEYAFIKTARGQGNEETAEKKNYEFVKTLLQQTDFNTAKIASLVNVDEAFVQKVKKGL